MEVVVDVEMEVEVEVEVESDRRVSLLLFTFNHFSSRIRRI